MRVVYFIAAFAAMGCGGSSVSSSCKAIAENTRTLKSLRKSGGCPEVTVLREFDGVCDIVIRDLCTAKRTGAASSLYDRWTVDARAGKVKDGIGKAVD